jgi:hypothetical protein
MDAARSWIWSERGVREATGETDMVLFEQLTSDICSKSADIYFFSRSRPGRPRKRRNLIPSIYRSLVTDGDRAVASWSQVVEPDRHEPLVHAAAVVGRADQSAALSSAFGRARREIELVQPSQQRASLTT